MIDLTWQEACFAAWTEVKAVYLCLQVSAWRVQRVSSVGLKVWLSRQEYVLPGFFVWWVPQCPTRQTTELVLSVPLEFSADRGREQVDGIKESLSDIESYVGFLSEFPFVLMQFCADLIYF